MVDLQHAVAVRLFEKLALAPVDNPPRVLDIGTGKALSNCRWLHNSSMLILIGTGIWAIEFGEWGLSDPDWQLLLKL